MNAPVLDPLVSIIIVNWNYERFVTQAIDSVKRQTYPQFECVVVDNGSADRSVETIERAIEGDNRFKLLRLERNLGHFGGAMAGLDHTSGRFIGFLDADDYYFPEFLSVHMQVHLSAIRPTAFTSSNCVTVDADGVLIGGAYQRFLPTEDRRFKPNLYRTPQFLVPGMTAGTYKELTREVYFGDENLGYWFWQHGSSNVVRREMLEVLRPPRQDDPPFGGVDTYFLISLAAITGATVLERSLSAYRLHENNDWNRLPQLHGVLAGNLQAYARNKVLKRLLMATIMDKVEDISSLLNPASRIFRFLEIVVNNSGETVLLGNESVFVKDDVINATVSKIPFFVQTFGLKTTHREFRKMMSFNELFTIMSRAFDGRKRVRVRAALWKYEFRRWYRTKVKRRKP